MLAIRFAWFQDYRFAESVTLTPPLPGEKMPAQAVREDGPHELRLSGGDLRD
jgi:hypothetical protein